MSFTRVSPMSKDQRVLEKEPDTTLFKDFRYVVDTQEWINKIIDFPLEIACPRGSKINISNCEFKKGLIVRLDYDETIESIFVFKCDIANYLKLFGSDHHCNKVENSIDIDSCIIDKIETIQIETKAVNIYQSNTNELIIEANIIHKLIIEKSNIGILLEHGNDIKIIDIHAGCFEQYGIIPKRIFSTLTKRYSNKENARDASLRTIDLLLKNSNITYPSHETSSLFYERNRVQTKSLLSRAILWLFGYFQSPMRYLSSAIILYSFIVLLLGIASLYSGIHIAGQDILQLAFNAFIGSSHMSTYTSDYLLNGILSVSIGMGTIFYSGLLVTLINRFRIRF